MANILPWWHPIRVAEQAAMLDVISGGRLEFGIGRGYQPREAEVFGRPYGATIQDQERNRSYYHEAYEIIMKAWTQPSFSHHGEFFSSRLRISSGITRPPWHTLTSRRLAAR
jgi:alkanesulfonate monooxygenase SsuD/methylene tetrahydromethanopterin reductase-like flavin-dependent oxidoreductase (luciferase family)